LLSRHYPARPAAPVFHGVRKAFFTTCCFGHLCRRGLDWIPGSGWASRIIAGCAGLDRDTHHFASARLDGEYLPLSRPAARGEQVLSQHGTNVRHYDCHAGSCGWSYLAWSAGLLWVLVIVELSHSNSGAPDLWPRDQESSTRSWQLEMDGCNDNSQNTFTRKFFEAEPQTPLHCSTRRARFGNGGRHRMSSSIPGPGGVWVGLWGEEDAPDFITAGRHERFRPAEANRVFPTSNILPVAEPLPFAANLTSEFTVNPIGAEEDVSDEWSRTDFQRIPLLMSSIAGCEIGWRDTFAGIRGYLSSK